MFQSNKLNLIISIVAAIVIWAYVITAINPTDERVISNVPVELINLESLVEDQLTVSPAQTYTVDVVVRGTRSDLSDLQPGDLKATANLKGFSKGTNSVDVVIAESDRFTVAEVRPQRIDIVVEDLVTAIKPIKISYTEKFPQDSEPGFVSLSPQEIEVGGTKDQVDSVSFIDAKVNSTELTKEETTLTVDAIPMKSNGDPVYNLRLSQQTIDVTATLCKVKEVPLAVNLVGDLPEGIGVTKTDIPKTIFIRGEAEILSNINEITANDINIGSLRETAIITPELNLPAHVELADASRNVVITIEVEGVEAKNLSYTADQIEIVDLAEGYTAHVNLEAVTVTIFGNKEQVEDFKSADLKLYIVMKDVDYTTNSVYVDVQFKYDKTLKRVDANPAQVQVVVEKIGGGDDAGDVGTGAALAPQE
jgi:YbbR domain-containing protein